MIPNTRLLMWKSNHLGAGGDEISFYLLPSWGIRRSLIKFFRFLFFLKKESIWSFAGSLKHQSEHNCGEVDIFWVYENMGKIRQLRHGSYDIIFKCKNEIL